MLMWSAVNAAPQVLTNNVLNFGDHLVLQQIKLSNKTSTLSKVVVKSNSFTNSVDRLGTATAITSRTLQKIPIATRNYTDLMFLSPLASGTGYMLDGVNNRRATFGGVTDAAFSMVPVFLPQS